MFIRACAVPAVHLLAQQKHSIVIATQCEFFTTVGSEHPKILTKRQKLNYYGCIVTSTRVDLRPPAAAVVTNRLLDDVPVTKLKVLLTFVQQQRVCFVMHHFDVVPGRNDGAGQTSTGPL